MSVKNFFFQKCCILLSGGKGTRMGGNIPKQYLTVSGRTLLEHSLHSVSQWEGMDALVVVAEEEWKNLIEAAVEAAFKNKPVCFAGLASPGQNRQMSVYNGLLAVKDKMGENSCVMIHDAVRPLASKSLLKRLDEAMRDSDGAMPVLPLTDTVYESTDGVFVQRNLNRSHIFAGQTPEIYHYKKYLTACEALADSGFEGIQGSSQPALMAGMKIRMVQGESMNFKITTREDLERFQEVAAKQKTGLAPI